MTITGPRQSGKTTLSKILAPNLHYANLELPDVRQHAQEDPRGFLGQHPQGMILDEIQRAPDLPSYIQGIVDERNTNGLYILTGSQQFELSQTISQSLAGRTAVLKLLPLEWGELYGTHSDPDLDTVLFNGFFPRRHVENIDPPLFFGSYVETYVERDLRQLSQIDNLPLFEKCVRLLAGRVGSLLNCNSLAGDLGVSQATVKKWVSLLEMSYIIHLLPPFYRNIGKRLVKTPKVYFCDTGLLCYLLGMEEVRHLQTHPLRGAIFENFVILEMLKHRLNNGLRSNLFFYRDAHGTEIDCLIEGSEGLEAVEIKSAQTANPAFSIPVNKVRGILGDTLAKATIIYDGSRQMTMKDCLYLPWRRAMGFSGA